MYLGLIEIKPSFFLPRKLSLLIKNAEVFMYIDSIVLYGLVIVALACIMITYVGVYAYKHIKEDSAKADQVINNKAV